ncbi:MAG: type I-U CRISPR-associated helicase/endonuclease Cas3 [Desulfobacterales bacterium]|jgi:CRISPR-associated endonuclease/helicase Cas3|nr:type I-U CRISPR-associated helicase/endonuclease Cas3 [Desulfobacterales bacterium]
MNRTTYFKEAYRLLTGHQRCFPWQERAFVKLADGVTPQTVSLPTGTGKTSIIVLWLIALAWQASQGAIRLPRRLVWVVNRRVVVDQATNEADNILDRLSNPASITDPSGRLMLADITRYLAELSLLGRMGKAPIAVSTLRGQLADNGEWKLDPSRPAIIIGTVDMIGSRLLFSGYGDGKYKRPQHAGLLGHDAWIVLDEAHLTPAFAELLSAIRHEQQQFSAFTPWRVSLLSATQRIAETDNSFTLSPEDEQNDVIGKRLWAKKALCIHELDENTDELDIIALLGLRYRDAKRRVLIFVKSPESAIKLTERIRKEVGAQTVRVLTGTQRGHERDSLVVDPIFLGFRSSSARQRPEKTHYLIATAAGEVGADLDADHLVCDLTTLDSLIQRFGRVNRLGFGESSVDLVVSGREEKNEKEKTRLAATLEYLKTMQHEMGAFALSPAAMVNAPSAAFSDVPATVPLARHWLDMWSLTSISNTAWPDRPEVSSWLHGVVENLPETWVVWRDDIEWLGRPDKVLAEDCAKAIDVYPILPNEQLRDSTGRVREKLKKLAQQGHNAVLPVILLHADGSIAWRGTLEALLAEVEKGQAKLSFATVLLPSSAGGLNETGLFEPRSELRLDLDVADRRQQRRRFYAYCDETGWKASPGVTVGDKPEYVAINRLELIFTIAKAENMKPLVMVPLDEARGDDQAEAGNERCLLYFAAATFVGQTHANSFSAPLPQALNEHNHQVGRVAGILVESLAATSDNADGLRELAEVLKIAGNSHDTGKGRTCWQQAIGNQDLSTPLAKSGHNRFNLRLNRKYRHEFGSLLDSEKALGPAQPNRELILHLLASHHGHARPHFMEYHFDRESALTSCQEAALQAIQRFGHLQARHGWWGLAYIEALLKAADALVSADINEGNIL